MNLSLEDDKELVDLALAKRQEGYTRLLVKYQDKVLNFISKFIGPSIESEDLMLISFDKAFSNLASYNPAYAFSTWLYRIVQNVCIDYLRKQRQFLIPLEDIREGFGDTPEEGMIAQQQQQAFIQFLKQLKPTYREVALLRYIDNYAYGEIAAKLNITVGNVKTRLYRIRQLLNNFLSQLMS